MPEVTVDGVRLNYVDVGVGDPPVVLLHAFPLHSEQWAPQIACLTAGRRVIAPDLKGFGGSDAPAGRDAYTMANFAGEVAGMLDHLGIETVVVGGLSMGGYVSFEFLRRYRDRVAGLILADTRASADTPEARERRTTQQGQIEAGEMGTVIDTLLEGLLCANSKQNRPELVDHVRQVMVSNPAAGFTGALEAMKNRADCTSDLSGIDVPTLVVVGEEDALSPPDVAAAMHEAIPGSTLAVLPHAGHLSNLEASDEFNDAVTAFLGW